MTPAPMDVPMDQDLYRRLAQAEVRIEHGAKERAELRTTTEGLDKKLDEHEVKDQARHTENMVSNAVIKAGLDELGRRTTGRTVITEPAAPTPPPKAPLAQREIGGGLQAKDLLTPVVVGLLYALVQILTGQPVAVPGLPAPVPVSGGAP